MPSDELEHPHLSRMVTSEVAGNAAAMSMRGALKRFPTMDREAAEDTLRKQNTGLDTLGQVTLSPDIQEILNSGEGRLMGNDEPKVPSIAVVSKETLPPQYGKDLPAFCYKLHAVEVHQYIPVEGVEAPEWMRNGGQPVALGQPEHICWSDPEKTGPICPTFNRGPLFGSNAPTVRQDQHSNPPELSGSNTHKPHKKKTESTKKSTKPVKEKSGKTSTKKK